MSCEIALKVEGVGKVFHIYEKPSDRLKQFIFPQFQRFITGTEKTYYRDFWAVQDISLEVGRGEVVGIIGRNGSGKSTLLQMICGTLNPTQGKISVNGRIAALLELGSGFNLDFSGRENVYINAAILGMSKDEIDSKFTSITDFADIGEFIDKPVKTYSSGMLVRLAFAVAISIDPDILIVDEALAVGDAIFQTKCFRRFQELKEKGVTILLVTHDVNMVAQLCNRAYVLHKGHLVASGPPKAMGDEYKRRCADEVKGTFKEKERTISSHYIREAKGEWLKCDPTTQEYGGDLVRITHFALVDADGVCTTKINSGEFLDLRIVLEFYSDCSAPILAFGVRDLKGQDVCGTNTWFENQEIGEVKAGTVANVSFRFNLPLQSGTYALNLACTEMKEQGLVVYHRLFDVAVLELFTERRFSGMLDIKPVISIDIN